jgi:transcription initiation factor IIE alpha subunit
MDKKPINGIEKGKRFFYIPNRIFEYRSKLTASARVIYIEIISICAKNNSYETDLTDEQLSQIVGVSLSTIRRSLTKLDKYNFIKRKRIGVRRKITLLDF